MRSPYVSIYAASGSPTSFHLKKNNIHCLSSLCFSVTSVCLGMQRRHEKYNEAVFLRKNYLLLLFKAGVVAVTGRTCLQL